MTRHDSPPRPSRLRCLAVWLLAGAATAVLVPWLVAAAEPATDFPTALVDLMALAGAATSVWLWLLTGLTALDAARGQGGRSRAGVPVGVRRVVLAACGVALASGLAVPAHADDGHPRPSVLTGLPLPDRPTTLDTLGLAFRLAEATSHPAPAHPHEVPHDHHEVPVPGSTVVVQPGDTLWDIAARHLPPAAGSDAIGRACAALYDLNRAVIGDDPDLIHPGQRLRLPPLTQEDS